MSQIFDSINVSENNKRFVDHSFDITDQIFHILEKKGKSQKDLAEILGKKESEVSKWMRGTHNFTIKSIAKIEAALHETIITTPLKSKFQPVPILVRTSELPKDGLHESKVDQVSEEYNPQAA